MKLFSVIFFILILFFSCTSINKSVPLSPKNDNSTEKKEEPVKSVNENIDEFGFHEKEQGITDDLSILNEETIEKSNVSKNSTSGLNAGFADDNKQFNYYLNFLKEYQVKNSYKIDINERIILKALDKTNKPLFKVLVEIFSKGKLIETGVTGTDGSYLFFPSEYSEYNTFNIRMTYKQLIQNTTIKSTGKREYNVKFDVSRNQRSMIPLDIVFVMDTTGSMGEEIERLKRTIEIINLNIVSLSSQPQIRFGMVLYKDRGDEEYITRIIPLTSDLKSFQLELNKVSASGGGDLPEDLQAALEDTVKRMKWSKEGINLAFIITDAPPHLDYNQEFTYVDAVKKSKEKGIKIFTVGTGELDLNGEYVLRQISQYTHAKYIFLTYGEKGESEGGSVSSVSHHTGANYQTDRLESIIIRFAKEELSYITDQKIDEDVEYFQAVKINAENKNDTLNKVFSMAIDQLIDYSSIKINPKQVFSFIPIISSQDNLKIQSEYFTDKLIVAFKEKNKYILVERSNLQQILKELELQLSGLVNTHSAVRVGQMEGADLIVIANMYKKNENYEIILKLLRVETSEVLSVTLVKVNQELGITD